MSTRVVPEKCKLLRYFIKYILTNLRYIIFCLVLINDNIFIWTKKLMLYEQTNIKLVFEMCQKIVFGTPNFFSLLGGHSLQSFPLYCIKSKLYFLKRYCQKSYGLGNIAIQIHKKLHQKNHFHDIIQTNIFCQKMSKMAKLNENAGHQIII